MSKIARVYEAGKSTGKNDRLRGLPEMSITPKDSRVWAEGYRAGWTGADPLTRLLGLDPEKHQR